MKNTFLAILYALLVLPGASTWAAAGADFYAVTVPVDNQSESARISAAREGLKTVLVRLTGSRTLDSDPRVQAMLGEVASYMVEYSYVTLPPDDAGQPGGLGVRIQYERGGLDQGLRTSRLPVWPVNRPPLLLWLVTDNPAGEPRVLDDEHTHTVLGRAFERRGLAPVYPLYDLEDQLAVAPVLIRDFDSEALARASDRYPVQGWLAVRLYETSGGQWRAAWMMEVAGQTLLREVQAATVEELLTEVADQAVDSIASRHAYVAGDSAGSVELDISGVASYRDYSRLMALLDAQAMVRQVRILAVEGDSLRISLSIEGGRDRLRDNWLRERSLEALPPAPPRTVISDADLLAGAPIPAPERDRAERLRWLPGR